MTSFLFCWLAAAVLTGIILAVAAETSPIREDFDWERDHLPFNTPMPLRLVRG